MAGKYESINGQGIGNLISNPLSFVEKRLTRSSILGLVIGGLVLIAVLFTPLIAMDTQVALVLLALLLGVFACIVLLRWPILGICGIIVAGLMVPLTLGTGGATGINAAVIVLVLMIGLWFLDMIARKREIRLIPSSAVTSVLVFCGIALIAFGFGQLPWFMTRSAPLGAQIGGLLIYLLSAGAVLLVAHQIQTKRELEWMTWILLLVGSLYFVGRMIPFINVSIYQIYVRPAALGAMFYIWFVAIALGQALFNVQLPRGWRLGLGAVVGIVFYLNIGLSRFWISGWMPALVAAVFVIFAANPRWGIFIIVVGGLFVLVDSQIRTDLVSEGDNAYSILTRLEAWRIMAEIIKANPIFGLGHSNYYWYTPLYSILGYNVQFNSHNQYIDIIAQMGLLGLAGFAWIIWEFWKLGWKMKNRVTEGFSKAFVIGILGGLAGTAFAGLLGDWAIPFYYNVGLEGFRASVIGWMFLGGLVALQRIEAAHGSDAA